MKMSGNYGRNTDGTFGKGNAGRPRGARNKATRAIASLLDGEADALTRKAINLALDGDTVALRLCLERILPAVKDAPVVFTLPVMSKSKHTMQAMASILKSVSEGEITPSEANSIARLVEGFRKTVEATELEERIEALEKITR